AQGGVGRKVSTVSIVTPLKALMHLSPARGRGGERGLQAPCVTPSPNLSPLAGERNLSRLRVMQYDAIIIGAGISGLYQLHCLRKLGLKTHVFESGTGVGGTWYWNRYPGARFDSESYSYGYSFSQELLDEWDWTEHFSPQPKTLEYLNVVADKFDLRRDITFSARVTAAHWHEQSRDWHVTLEDGGSHSARFLITAIGPLSAPTMPRIEGIESFKGLSAQTARTLTVFQRTPNWTAPLHNKPISKAEMAEIRTQYPDILKRCQETFSCFLHTPDPRGTFEVTPEEREAKWE